MSFFEPIDVPPLVEESEPVMEEPWIQPEWQGPSETVIGGVVPLRAALHHDDCLAIWIDRVTVYPNGLLVSLELYLPGAKLDGKEISGRFPWALTEIEERPWMHREQPTDSDDYFRFGIRYEDGRTAVTTTWEEGESAYCRLSENPPQADDLVLMQRHGSGGGGRGSIGLWVWPAPGSGSVELLAEWPAVGVAQVAVAMPEELIHIGRREIVDLWPVHR